MQDIRDGCQTDLRSIGKVVNLGISDHNLDCILIEFNNSISRPANQLIFQNDDYEAIIPYPQNVSRVPRDTGTYAITGSVGIITGRLSGDPLWSRYLSLVLHKNSGRYNLIVDCNQEIVAQ